MRKNEEGVAACPKTVGLQSLVFESERGFEGRVLRREKDRAVYKG